MAKDVLAFTVITARKYELKEPMGFNGKGITKLAWFVVDAK